MMYLPLSKTLVKNHLLDSDNLEKIETTNSFFFLHVKEFTRKNMSNPIEKENEKDIMKKYVETLSEKELQSYQIASSHLGTSFQLEKSRGYLEWKQEYLKQNQT